MKIHEVEALAGITKKNIRFYEEQGLLAQYLAVVLFGLLTETMMPALAVGILLVYAGVIVAVMVGILAALRQRLKEIEGGGEDDASKY